MTYQGRSEIPPSPMVRPYVDLSVRKPTINVPHVPVDVLPDRAEQWLAGYAKREAHQFDPVMNQCVECGSTSRPYCGYNIAGYNEMRASLRNPASMPIAGP